MRRAAPILTVAVLAALAAGIGASTAPAGAAACGSGAHGSPGYSYAGREASARAHGVRATIAATTAPDVRAGHAAGWVGVGGPGAGANGRTQWLQAGIALLPATPPLVYAEITRASGSTAFRPLLQGVALGEAHSLAVLEVAGTRDRWRVWVDGKPATEPIHLPGSSGRWRPIATAESWNGGRQVCNRFGFRFEGVQVAGARGGSWRTFPAGATFLDRGFTLRALTPAGGPRSLSETARPYAFLAASA